MPINVLEGNSFASKLGSVLGQSIGGVGGALAGGAYSSRAKEKELQQKINMLNQLKGRAQAAAPDQKSLKERFFEAAQALEEANPMEAQLHPEIISQKLDKVWSDLQQEEARALGTGAPSSQEDQDYFDMAETLSLMEEPELAKILTERAKAEERSKHGMEKMAEPKLEEMEDKLDAYEASDLRFSRLNELFSPENEKSFPPALLASIFSKEGQIIPTLASQLSPDAQEAVKLVTDELSGAKGTFGARVTNFELETYLKRLPTLMNTAEGRRRVLRDLRIMNKLNMMQSEGVLNTVDKYGGPRKISISKAKRIWKAQNAAKIAEMKKEFIRPGSTDIKTLDDTSAFLHAGEMIEDTETGQRFRSNGSSWEPV